jgi:4-hydroxy-tetrahydrodipicolinate synthase
MEFESNLPRGLFTASLTPMNDDLSVNYNSLIEHIKWLLNNGSNGICLLGTTGEANSFSIEERMDVLDEVIEADLEPQRLLVGTGTCVISDTIILTQHAVSKGVGGVLMLPPFYYKDLSDQGVLDYFRLVIEGVDDPNLKIYLYNFPKMTGVPFTLDLVKKLVAAFPGKIVGMKDSSGNWQAMQSVCEEIPGFQLFTGTEKYLLDTLRAGGAGCISATFNASIKYGAKVYSNWHEPEVDNLQAELNDIRKKFEVDSFISSLKFLFAKWFDEPNWLNVRPPNSLPNADTQDYLIKNFKQEEYF